ncbi:hypothetical protein GCG54_00013385 [Colletotrichum gloeosporioides]|uniref:Uncharacterized protein n=1 Tax=Colletotrichum gloeosporioides TaxID=474922 RepID=A0A8H4CGM1_COLGL|nr:uncharacterized protein GCG54_00013385 [Colletotrichum gloeosporioides]KAF3803277.1 hypothetical protein GCG54_00013385 [Colletotrichum gloeosporioides]
MSHFEPEDDNIFRHFCTRCNDAWDLYAEGKLDEATAMAEAILREEPQPLSTHKALLHVLLSRSKDSTKAVQNAQKAVDLYRFIMRDSEGASTSSNHVKFHIGINLRRAEGDLQLLIDQQRLERLSMVSLEDKQSEPDESQDEVKQEDNDSQEEMDLVSRVLMQLPPKARSPTPTPTPTSPTVKSESSTPS